MSFSSEIYSLLAFSKRKKDVELQAAAASMLSTSESRLEHFEVDLIHRFFVLKVLLVPGSCTAVATKRTGFSQTRLTISPLASWTLNT